MVDRDVDDVATAEPEPTVLGVPAATSAVDEHGDRDDDQDAAQVESEQWNAFGSDEASHEEEAQEPDEVCASAAVSSPSRRERGVKSIATPAGAEVVAAPAAAGAKLPEFSDPEGTDSSAVEVVKEGAQACQEAMLDRVYDLVGRSPPVVQAYYASLRPWDKFALMNLPQDGQEARERAFQNLPHYQSNYLTLLLGVVLLTLLGNVTRLVMTCVIVFVWLLCERSGFMDPAWNPRFGEVTCALPCRLVLMVFMSLIALLASGGSMVFVAVGAWALVVMAHAALHPCDVWIEKACAAEGGDAEEAQALVQGGGESAASLDQV